MVAPQHILALSQSTHAGLLFGLLLVAAIMGGYIAHILRIPRVIGYLLAGVGLKVLMSLLVDKGGLYGEHAQTLIDSQGPLQAIKDLALGLILFSIGKVFETRHIRAVSRNVFRIGLASAAATALLVFCGVFIAGLASSAPATTVTLGAMALLLGLAATATAPAATLFTLQEYEAKGTETDTVLSVTGFSDILCIVGFQVCFLLMMGTGVLGQTHLSTSQMWWGIFLGTVGSALLGAVLGFALSIVHAKLEMGETLLILISSLIVLGAGEHWLLEHVGISYNFLLTALCCGAVFTNVAIDPDRMETTIHTIGPPLFVGFFVLAGFQLHLEDLVHLRAIGVVYVVCRIVGKVGGSWLGVRWIGGTSDVNPAVGTGLLCQAAVVIGLADFVGAHWHHEWASRSFVTTILGSAVIFEVCGPVLLKRLVVRCGEVKAVTLLRRSGPSASGGQSILSLTTEALLRSLGLGRTKHTEADGPLQVRHIMRANVKCIPASATLDEVLRFVERSRFDHFPVTDANDDLIGVIRYSDLSQFIYDPVLANLVTAQDLSTSTVRSVPADMPLEESMAIFKNHDAGSLPVVSDSDSRHVIGIIEQRDLLNALRSSRNKG